MKINKETFSSYIQSRNDIELLAIAIWNYVRKNYEEYLEYGKCSRYDKWRLDTKNGLSISYYDHGYDIYENTWINDIPFEVIFNDTWKEYIDEIFNKKIEAQKREEELEKKERKELYEQLKQEFEDAE